MTSYSSIPPSMESRDGFTFADLEPKHWGWMTADHHHGRELRMTIDDGPYHFPFDRWQSNNNLISLGHMG